MPAERVRGKAVLRKNLEMSQAGAHATPGAQGRGRRDQIKMTPAEIADFLHGRHHMSVATFGPDGRVHLVAMWYGFLDEDPALWTYARSQKVVNLRRDPRITCLVEAGDAYDELRGVELVGQAEIVEDPDTVVALGADVFARYSGPIDDAQRETMVRSSAKRVAVRIRAERTVSWDHRKLAGAY